MWPLPGRHSADAFIGVTLDARYWMLDHSIESFFFIKNPETDIQYLLLLSN